ncbi:conserved hypothetical protein [Talaromyces stipitatus ATCC 10500]|uniref:Uncharacterized protein n=1 Tax=Talaromyces stipitatus (strain ATCC 10500 / CBS 375.48 / QM 6759 / NRRL 1006) TaxID=441959 RepID=B8MBH3_TALSN|nr:uncharacterized protein TSTA_116270 [Talaromyces stipitatus ATCC 10500]EED17837.1 conserved hypothetical protein [Talaromyces stipitatus ATCC 10500]
MGVNSRRPLLPAPTESIVDTTGSSLTTTDMATDVSRRTDKSSYSLPDDGSPITISTRRRSSKKDDDDSSKLSRTSHQSQTSLLIEYFEREKNGSKLHSRPSVRVKVIPSGRKNREHGDTIQIREGGSSKRPHYTRRISVSTPSRQKTIAETNDDQSVTDDEQGNQPLEIEFLDRGNGSDLSNERYIQPTSEISSMPADSMLDGSNVSGVPRRKRSQSLDKARGTSEADLLKAPSRRRSRSLSRERIAYRVAQKLNAGDGARNTKELLGAESKPLKKRSHKYEDEEQPSVESSLLSGSNVSSRHKSGDALSFRSNTSKSSLNNTKFLETVEDAIRRLILPELKELKKDQKVSDNKLKFERDTIESGSGVNSKDVPKRQLSKHSSAPDVSKSSLFVASPEKEEAVTPEERRRRHKERRREKERETGTASPEDKIRIRKGSLPGNQREFTEEEKLRRQRSKGLRDAAAAGIVGSALTAAALKHHDSKSSLGKKPRKRKSKSHSSLASINDTDTELVFQKHNVPPMPFRSDIDTELTRDSLLSQRTSDSADTETPTPRQIKEVIRGSPRDLASPSPGTPLGSHRELSSRQSDRSGHEVDEKADFGDDDVFLEGAGGAIAAAAAGNLLGHHPDHDMLGPEEDIHHPRALSPIQSVASDHDLHQTQQEEVYQDKEADDRRYSIQSLSSAPSTELARSTRPEGISFESRSEILKQHDEAPTELGYETDRNIESENGKEWNETSSYAGHDDDFHDENLKADTNYNAVHVNTYDNYDDTPRELNEGAAVNPKFVTPVAVESAVASLLEPSVMDTRSGLSQARSQADSLNRSVNGSNVEEVHEQSQAEGSRRGSPLKHEYDLHNHDEKSFTKRLGAASPPQSVTQSDEDVSEQEERFPLDSTIVDNNRDIHLEEAQYEEEESEINTNPSIIQGPIGSVPHGSRDHWPYSATPPQVRDLQSSPQHDLNPAAAAAIGGGLGAGLGLSAAEHGIGYDQTYGQGYMSGRMYSTPPGAKDEGYISAANPMSPSNGTPEPRNKFSTLDHANPPLLFDNRDLEDDPFVGSGHQRHFSGYSHGMASPIYDSATGRGLDSIESKDIIALMNHLTVRDAQRNARDTEILVTLVRSAAEMRSSFLEMKKFIAEQDELLMEANEKQHERTRAIGGPRPLPASRSNRQLAAADYGEEVQAKRRNVFRRAMKSLSLKSSNDLTKIEDMLEQLLDEVEALRNAQEGRSVGTAPATNAASLNSNINGGAYPDGYEPEGLAGTGSPDGQSGYTSNSSRPLADSRPMNTRRPSGNRISTVLEGDEEIDTYEQPLLEREVPYDDRVADQRSVPEHLGTPPRKPVPTSSGSQETTPRKSDEKARKHKSNSSSFFKISRWSKTTASSVGEGIRNSMQTGRKERPSSEMSRSGSDLAKQDHYNTGDFYDPLGDDRLRSTYTLDEGQQDNRPPSPLVPSQVSEGPKYKAHRDSLNLQHPQPQKGPTDRYQTHLESQAQDYAPNSPSSERWGSQSSLPHYSANATNRYSSGNARLTPISDAGYSEVSSSRGPPRPPKIKDAGPLVPQRPPKIKEDGSGSPHTDRFSARNNRGSASPVNQPPTRKPTGPRPITSSGQYSPGNIKRHQYRGSPNKIDYDDEY